MGAQGGLAMLARIGDRARVTADADATWRTTVTQLQEMLEDAAEADLADHFEFLIGQGRPIQAEGAEGGLRLPVRCLLAGRSFEILRLYLNLVPSDPRPLDRVELRNLFDFTDLPTVVVPAVRVEQQLAEKLHAYTLVGGTFRFTTVVLADRPVLDERSTVASLATPTELGVEPLQALRCVAGEQE